MGYTGVLDGFETRSQDLLDVLKETRHLSRFLKSKSAQARTACIASAFRVAGRSEPEVEDVLKWWSRLSNSKSNEKI